MRIQVPEIVRQAAEKAGCKRVRYFEKDMPTSISNVCILPFFGDVRSTFVLSSLLLNRYKEEVKGSKYFILCSWPGYEGMFPYVNEYWTLKDKSSLKNFFKHAGSFDNESSIEIPLRRNFNHFFEDVIGYSDLKVYYDNGITQDFLDRFKKVKRFLPAVPSASAVTGDFSLQLMKHPGEKVFIYPSLHMQGCRYGKLHLVNVQKEFWIEFVRKLIKAKYVPVIYQNYATYDLSPDFAGECIIVNDESMLNVLGAMRAAGCVVDLFSGISKLAIAARCPFILCEERKKFALLKDFEINDLCGKGVPKEYIYSFTTIIESGNIEDWTMNFYDTIVAKLDNLLSSLDRDDFPPTSEVNEPILYSEIRKKKLKKLGTRFVKIKRD